MAIIKDRIFSNYSIMISTRGILGSWAALNTHAHMLGGGGLLGQGGVEDGENVTGEEAKADVNWPGDVYIYKAMADCDNFQHNTVLLIIYSWYIYVL